MEKVDATALDGAMWWPNAGRVIKVPEEGEAAVLFGGYSTVNAFACYRVWNDGIVSEQDLAV